MKTIEFFKIGQLAADDPAQKNGARWVVLAPKWIGVDVEIRGTKTDTLERAVNIAENGGGSLMCTFDAVSLDGEPQDVFVMKKKLGIV